jgi:hypothetical protein
MWTWWEGGRDLGESRVRNWAEGNSADGRDGRRELGENGARAG